MSRSIPVEDYVEDFDPELAPRRAWLLAVLEQLVAHDPMALEEGGTLRRQLWQPALGALVRAVRFRHLCLLLAGAGSVPAAGIQPALHRAHPALSRQSAAAAQLD